MAGAWLRATGAAVSQACIAAGELIAAERQERARLRSRWPKVWKRAKAKKLRRWVQPPPAGSRPGAFADVRLSLRNGPVLTSLRLGQLTVDPACLPDRGGPLRSLRHHPA
jgi:hypothetical protein